MPDGPRFASGFKEDRMSISSIMVLCVLTAACGAGAGEVPTPYDAKDGTWLVDPVGLVARNDVVYDGPSPQPWEAMPVGGGDLSAMVRFDGDLHLHLTKSDAWGFQAPADAKPGTRFFNNVSPGHVRLNLGDRGKAAAARRLRQRLDLYHGRIVIELGDAANPARFAVWGPPDRTVLIVDITDPSGTLIPSEVELTEWRDTMRVGGGDGRIHAREVHTRPARPHLSNTGMQDYFEGDADPLKGRGLAVAVGMRPARGTTTSADDKTARLRLPHPAPNRCVIVIAAATTTSGDPLARAERLLDETFAQDFAELKRRHGRWWRCWWSRSDLRITSSNRSAEWLCAAYHVHLYTLGCVNRGPYPAKWDGGPGLMRRDERTWGLAEWVQEVRFTYMPLYAANRLEMARGLCDHYHQMRDYLVAQTRTMWDQPGLWIPETVLPWGHAEDWVLDDDGRGAAGHYQKWDHAKEPYGRFDLYNPYVGFLFTAGLEVCHHVLAYDRYSGDETFLRQRGYPILRGVCAFVAGLLRLGEDGRYHLDPANALETWWMVRDPADTLDGIRAIFPKVIAVAERLDKDPPLRRRWKEILAKLPAPSLGHWDRSGTCEADADTYAPAAALGRFDKSRNFENPELYRVYPFGLSGIGSADRERAVRTFRRRLFTLPQSWSMDAIWAARLGLADDAHDLAVRHAKAWNRYRYGGWDSANSSVFPGGLAVAPYIDGAGVSAFSVNEMLLQSHDGVIRVLPATPATWSGLFRLRAEGGFLVGAAFDEGEPQLVEITSLLGRPCRVANPWPDGCSVWNNGASVAAAKEGVVDFETACEGRYLLLPSGRNPTHIKPIRLKDQPNSKPGLPGRDG